MDLDTFRVSYVLINGKHNTVLTDRRGLLYLLKVKDAGAIVHLDVAIPAGVRIEDYERKTTAAPAA